MYIRLTWKYNMHVPSHLTPASSEWSQLCCPMGLILHSNREDSVPLHTTLSNRISPLPFPKYAPPTATEPTERNLIHYKTGVENKTCK